jgi:hypothetical protein
MTWAEMVGELATRLVMVVLTAIRIFTELLRLVAVTLDKFVLDLGTRSEAGLRRTETSERAWIRLPGTVLLGLALAVLLFLAIFTVLFRQAATLLNSFVIGLSEGEERILGSAEPVERPAG